MASITLELDADVVSRLQERARAAGLTVAELVADMVAAASDEFPLTAEQEAGVAEAWAAVERGEWVAEADVMARVRAARR